MPSSWMVRTDIIKQFLFGESLYQGECGEWWIRTTGSVIKTRCPKMLLKYRLRINSLSTTTPSKQRKLKVVTHAARPGLGLIIYVLSWCVWLFPEVINIAGIKTEICVQLSWCMLIFLTVNPI